MAKPKPSEVYGVSVLKAPGGGLVVVAGPIDLSRAESLSPAWTRELQETRPAKVTSEPDNQGHTVTSVLPMLTKVGEVRIHGESVGPTAKRLNKAAGRLLNAALLGKDVATLEQLEAMLRTEKPVRKHRAETRYDKWIRAERALDLLGKSDVVAARILKASGRTEAQVAKYIEERAEFVKRSAA